MISRRPREGPDPFLGWKVSLFFAGAALILAGIFTDIRPLVAGGVALALGGLLLRAVERVRNRRGD